MLDLEERSAAAEVRLLRRIHGLRVVGVKQLVGVQRIELLAGHTDDLEHAVVPVQLPGHQIPIEHAVLGRFVDDEAIAGLRLLPGP